MHPAAASPFARVPGAVPPTGRVALVLGGGSGLGAVVVRALAAAGWSVAIHAHASLAAAREAVAALSDAGVAALAVTADLRDEGAVRTLVHRVAGHFGRIDALVTCAAVRRAGAVDEPSAEALRSALDVACVGAVVAAREFAAVTSGGDRGGSIVLVGDAERPGPGRLARVVTGTAVAAAARGLVAEFSAREPPLRVNVVAPAADAPADRVAHAVLFLLDNDAVDGVCLPVTGRPRTAGGP